MDYNLINNLRQQKPLIHHITNTVTINDCANITLNIGALPVMANALEEVEEMVQHAGALVLNIGTLTVDQIQAMLITGKKANELKIPVVLDPVGVGATALRTESVFKLLEEVRPTVIKGNAAEISILAGQPGQIKGVESIGEYTNIKVAAKTLAQKYACIVVVSGKEDIITDGTVVYFTANGDARMAQVVGTGCMAASVIGSFLGTKADVLEATIQALIAYEVAGELAAERPEIKGPGTYKAALLDEIFNLNDKLIKARAKVRKE